RAACFRHRVAAVAFADGGRVATSVAIANRRGEDYVCAAMTDGENPMFIAMNRFRVKKGSEQDFEDVWMSRDTHLQRVPGFVEFHLLKGPEHDDHTLYASHTVWQSRAAFEAWTRSEEFRAAHSRAGDNKPLYLDHPQFEGFEVRQTVKPAASAAA